jgi:hypothetical protein
MNCSSFAAFAPRYRNVVTETHHFSQGRLLVLRPKVKLQEDWWTLPNSYFSRFNQRDRRDNARPGWSPRKSLDYEHRSANQNTLIK